MDFKPKKPPRTFQVGVDGDITIRDMAEIYLAPNEQITFLTEEGATYDVARKDWGFYATPSVNGRLKNEGFKTALVRNEKGRVYVMLVEARRRDLFDRYCLTEMQTVLTWLDES
jgi:hypothetical protein